MIPYARQSISQSDIDTVVEALKSDYLTQGQIVPKFEASIAKYTGAKHGIAVNSGTSALHIACLALGLGKGDYLWTSPNSFVASANCARYCGAEVDFVDIDPDTWNMSVSLLSEKLKKAAKENRLPKIVIPVHFAGQPTEQEKIWELAKEYNFYVIEDASHSIGAKRNNENVGSCKWSHITTFSFHAVKIITTGEGGMAMTNDEDLAWKMSMFRTHGITRENKKFINKEKGPWYYEQLELGYNYRMTELQAALGLNQLSRLDEIIKTRNQLANVYNENLIGSSTKLPIVKEENYSSFHIYVVRIKTDKLKKTQKEIFTYLKEQGIGVNVHYMPIHLQPYYKKIGYKTGMFKEAEIHGNEAITLPLYEKLNSDDQFKVIDKFRKIVEV